VAAVGSVTAGIDGAEDLRAAMRSIVQDQALVEGHDPALVLHRTNAQLRREGIGSLDAVALLTHHADGTGASIVGAGWPAPLAVAPDGVATPVRGSLTVGPGWAIVLGAAGGPQSPFERLLSPDEVRQALALLSPRPMTAAVSRTLLTVAVDE
jgi:hypothetical protein